MSHNNTYVNLSLGANVARFYLPVDPSIVLVENPSCCYQIPNRVPDCLRSCLEFRCYFGRGALRPGLDGQLLEHLFEELLIHGRADSPATSIHRTSYGLIDGSAELDFRAARRALHKS